MDAAAQDFPAEAGLAVQRDEPLAAHIFSTMPTRLFGVQRKMLEMRLKIRAAATATVGDTMPRAATVRRQASPARSLPPRRRSSAGCGCNPPFRLGLNVGGTHAREPANDGSPEGVAHRGATGTFRRPRYVAAGRGGVADGGGACRWSAGRAGACRGAASARAEVRIVDDGIAG